jgi:hypothetical protein
MYDATGYRWGTVYRQYNAMQCNNLNALNYIVLSMCQEKSPLAGAGG